MTLYQGIVLIELFNYIFTYLVIILSNWWDYYSCYFNDILYEVSSILLASKNTIIL